MAARLRRGPSLERRHRPVRETRRAPPERGRGTVPDRMTAVFDRLAPGQSAKSGAAHATSSAIRPGAPGSRPPETRGIVRVSSRWPKRAADWSGEVLRHALATRSTDRIRCEDNRRPPSGCARYSIERRSDDRSGSDHRFIAAVLIVLSHHVPPHRIEDPRQVNHVFRNRTSAESAAAGNRNGDRCGGRRRVGPRLACLRRSRRVVVIRSPSRAPDSAFARSRSVAGDAASDAGAPRAGST